MSESVISVADAAKNFLRVLERVESTQEPTLLMRDGYAVAQILPLPVSVPGDYRQAILHWQNLDRLPPEDAKAFANDLEKITADQPPAKSPWD